ncbi:hypothetical protein TNCV_754501 [Trichonephila clavipes]|nr:hypothetical protein TNCV_754501 [Trichonephila clavipes]
MHPMEKPPPYTNISEILFLAQNLTLQGSSKIHRYATVVSEASCTQTLGWCNFSSVMCSRSDVAMACGASECTSNLSRLKALPLKWVVLESGTKCHWTVVGNYEVPYPIVLELL